MNIGLRYIQYTNINIDCYQYSNIGFDLYSILMLTNINIDKGAI